MNEQPQAELLEQYYAALAHDFAASPPPALDPATAALAQRMCVAIRQVKPSAAFHLRLREQITALHRAEGGSTAQPLGRLESNPMQTNKPNVKPHLRSNFRFAATAAVLMLIAMSALLLSGIIRLRDNSATTVGVQPAPAATQCTGPLGAWHDIAALNQPIAAGAGASDDTYLYIAGGFTDFPHKGITNALFRYDPIANKWYTMTAATDSFGFASASYAPSTHNLYVFGGYSLTGSYLNLTRIYNPATDRWSVGAAMPQPRHSMTAAYSNGKIYLIGGHDGGGASSQTWAYDPQTDKWTTDLANLPQKLYGVSGGTIDGHIYVVGGSITPEAANGFSAATYDYNIAANTWQQQADLPQPLMNASSAVVGQRLYIYGGINSNSEAVKNSYSYDPASNSWLNGPLLTQIRGVTGGASIGNTIYSVAGFNRGGTLDTGEAVSVICGK